MNACKSDACSQIGRPPRINMAGRRYGRLTVVRPGTRTGPKGRPRWFCLCDCGVSKDILGSDIRDGKTKSCGCLNRDRAVAFYSTLNLSHGLSRQSTYHIWVSMRARCRNPQRKDFKNYGGRGIDYCESWHFFANFLADMGRRPDGLTLERIDVNGNYEPGNCKWATWEEQRLNTRKRAAAQMAA